MTTWARNIASSTLLAAAMAATTHAAQAANEGWYVGGFAGHVSFASERSLRGSAETSVAGLQLGINCCELLDVELGYGKSMGGDDVDLFAVNAIKYLEADDGSWRPFLLAGLNRYDFQESDFLVDGHQLRSTQWLFGAGAAKAIDEQFFFRAELRLAEGRKSASSGTDLGLQLSINRRFGASSAAKRQPQLVAPAVAPATVAEPMQAPATLRVMVEFATDSAEVRSFYSEQLSEVAALLEAEPETELLLVGHTDSTGSSAYNQQLSERRAAAVKSYIVDRYSITAARISTAGRGESEPLQSNDSAEGRAANRRVIGQIDYVESAAQ